MLDQPLPFHAKPAADVLSDLRTTPRGLSAAEAAARLAASGPGLGKMGGHSVLLLFFSQFKSPIILILIFAAVLSYFLDDPTDAIIILVIVGVSGLLGFWQERGAAGAVAKLLAMVETKGTALRDGKPVSIPFGEFVPGDIVCLDAGRGVPGDCLILSSKDLFANEAALTGETFPVEKCADPVPPDTPLAKRQNVLFMGSHVVSGTALAVVAATGRATEFGKVSARLRAAPRETDFERGIRRFGFMLMEITLVMMTGIFALNVLFDKPVADSFMFSLALAVGLTPQLLPAIVSVNLAAGARRLAASKVIVRRLAAIENFGSMNVLCSDKTGTLTDGAVHIKGAYDASGAQNPGVFELAYVNGSFQSGFANPIDQAIKEKGGVDMAAWEKLDEIPYDFVRKRLGILARHEGKNLLVVKGALLKILEVCDRAAMPGGGLAPLSSVRDDILARYESYGHEGLRCMGLAYRDMDQTRTATKADESGMVFAGFLTLWDPPKPGIAATVANLAAKGVRLKVITGDNRHVADSLGRQMGLAAPVVLTGPDLRAMSPDALVARAPTVDVFAEVEPNQKEDIVRALQKAGFVVGFMGDGINDASAIKAADVGLSVDGAVDVAKEAADIVLLDPDLGVLENGVLLGRQTFANTLKYIFMATSANFGNMFSMAGASLFLPFLPLLPTQVLLTNLLTDLPEMTIASDAVDPDMVERPRRWDIRFIRNFMLVFGPLSSVFDCLTFVVLLHFLHASEALFQTGWFVESVVSAALIVLVVRTKRTMLTSRPSRLLLWATLAVVGVTLWLPFGPLAELFGFVPLPWAFLPALAGIVVLYVLGAELAKKWFYRRFG